MVYVHIHRLYVEKFGPNHPKILNARFGKAVLLRKLGYQQVE